MFPVADVALAAESPAEQLKPTGGQITAGGYDNDEPLTLCPIVQYDGNGGSSLVAVPCHNQHLYVLTPVGR